MSVEKKRRVSPESNGSSSTTTSFENGEKLELVGWDRRARRIHTMAIDNHRHLLYLLEHVLGRGLAMEQFALLTPHDTLSVMATVPSLVSFPPGILPIVAAYGGHWARRTWQRFMSWGEDLYDSSDEPTQWEKAEVESSTGDLICSFSNTLEFARVTSTGSLTVIRHDDEELGAGQIAQPTHWSLVRGSSECMMATGIMGHVTMYKVEWKHNEGTYAPQDVVEPILPGSTSSFVMDTHHIYAAQSTGIVRFPCGTRGILPGERIYQPETDRTRVMGDIMWCEPCCRHLLFATRTDLEEGAYSRFDLVWLIQGDSPLGKCVFTPYTLVTDIPHYDSGPVDISLDVGLLTSACSGPSHVLVRSETDFRIFPLPFPLVCKF